MSRHITNSRILVTGGAGFIGSNLVKALLEQDNEVICLDNFITGKHENLASIKDHKHFTLIEGDIRNFDDCSNAVDGVQYILHQAALGSVPRSIIDPITTNSHNITGFLNMITAARDAKVKRFVYAASSSVYGDHPGLPKYEDHIGKPLSPYAITKYVNELYAKVFSDVYGLETIGLRYFNVFGPNQDPDGAYAAVIPKFITQFMKYEAPVIHGAGDTSRDFTYIDNVIQINQLAALTKNEEALNTVFNVACSERTTLNELTETLQRELALFDKKIADIEPIHGVDRKGDIKHSHASIEKAKELLEYSPKVLVNEGLGKTVKWFWENK
jgi:UDP-N-acetylglucosamine/UDP-N-acetylgalactosamine 4-epimerase